MSKNEIKLEFVTLRAKGATYQEISNQLSVTKQTLINWSKEYSLVIANLKQIEIEALLEKFWISNKKRIEIFGEQIKLIKNELDSRSLKDLSTNQLFDLLFKFEAVFRTIHQEITFKEKQEISFDLDVLDEKSWQG